MFHNVSQGINSRLYIYWFFIGHGEKERKTKTKKKNKPLQQTRKNTTNMQVQDKLYQDLTS